MSDESQLRRAAKVGAVGAAGFAAVYGTILLLRVYGESAPEFGYLPELLLFQLMLFAIGFGGSFAGQMLGVEWQRSVLAVLGSHLLWLMVIYGASIYIDVPNPNAMVFAVAGGFGIMLLLSERSAVETRWIVMLGAIVTAGAAGIWLAPSIGYLIAGMVWAVAPALGSVILSFSVSEVSQGSTQIAGESIE